MPSVYKHLREVIGAIIMIIITFIITSRIVGHIHKTFGESVVSTIAPLFSVLAFIIAATLIIAVVAVIVRYLRDQF
jgi:TRAP-type C4-dicarboxylate transport system permease small subunit